MGAGQKDALYGRWVHSHEDDTADEMVFRPATHPFPPSRGRISFELHADGTYVEQSPGPVDLPVQSRGRWSQQGDRLVLSADHDRSGHAWEIVAASDDRLIVRKGGGPGTAPRRS